jgi:hypothetical protein
MKVDFVIAGANIIEKTMIDYVIKELPDSSHINKKYILLDGPRQLDDDYKQYCETIQNDYPDFIVKCFDKNIYFKEMMKWICNESDAELLFVCQDDVRLHLNNLDNEIENMKYLPFCNIISFPHKKIKYEGTHWFSPHLDLSDYYACHGWSERTFLCKREELLKSIQLTENDSKSIKTKNYIDTIYHLKMKTRRWDKMSEREQMDYWVSWGSYISTDVFHSHLVGHRPN